MRPLFLVVRLLGAAAIVAAIATQLANNIGYWMQQGLAPLSALWVNFFSFFTIDSNVLTVVVFLIGAGLLIRGRGEDPRWFALLRASTTAYMATTGIVYNVLLRGIELPQGSTLAWSNEVLHVVGPILMVVDWFFAPGRARLDWKAIWVIIAFPLVWGVYTMIRGPFTFDAMTGNGFWYPDPFLNPNIAPEGYVSVAFYIVLIAAIIGGVGALVIWVSRRRERWPLPAEK
jgi:hypothetical protein